MSKRKEVPYALVPVWAQSVFYGLG
uniref:Uncharacterized protein n=1 Tax=mine drainage metagenome TaxID=410659 RepID=E6QFN2_9ZZZZ